MFGFSKKIKNTNHTTNDTPNTPNDTPNISPNNTPNDIPNDTSSTTSHQTSNDTPHHTSHQTTNDTSSTTEIISQDTHNDTILDYVGFKYGNPAESPTGADAETAYGISAQQRVHTAIFGLPGCGKSSIISLLAYQNIIRGEGLMVIDPHGELIRTIMSMVPQERHKDVIYVNPASLYRYGTTVQINPLEVKSEQERYIVVMAFVSMLYNLYKDSWGPRLETVLRNAANAAVESGKSRMQVISALITDESARAEILDGVASKSVRHFWQEIFQKQYARDAGSSAYNKMDKILATPTVAAIFDTDKSSISMQDVMRDKRMLLVDLSTGASDDIAEFLGSIFLNMLYIDAKKRLDLEGEQTSDNRFYVYVDEAHMFSSLTMSEMLRALRKFGVRVTLATQTASAFDDDFAKSITGLCKTLITGRCDQYTAGLLKTIMGVSSDVMQTLPDHTFTMSSDEAGVRAKAVMRSRPVPLPGRNITKWEDLAEYSSKLWGSEINLERYIPSSKSGKLLFSPIEACIIHMLDEDKRGWLKEEIIHTAEQVFHKILERSTKGALDRLVRDRYVNVKWPDIDKNTRDVKKRYVLGDHTHKTYLSEAAGGPRAGSEKHLEVIFMLARVNRQKHRYCIADLGDSGNCAPDLLVVEPDTSVDRYGKAHLDPFKWNDRTKLAVEVETNPKRQIEQAIKNYSKNIALDYDVWFICFEDSHRIALENAIRARYPSFERCKMDVINYNMIISGTMKIPDTYDESFTRVDVQPMNRLVGKPDDVVDDVVGNTVDDVVDDVVKGVASDANTMPSSDATSVISGTKKKQYVVKVCSDISGQKQDKHIEQNQLKDVSKNIGKKSKTATKTSKTSTKPSTKTSTKVATKENIALTQDCWKVKDLIFSSDTCWLNLDKIRKNAGLTCSRTDLIEILYILVKHGIIRIVYGTMVQKTSSNNEGEKSVAKRMPIIEAVLGYEKMILDEPVNSEDVQNSIMILEATEKR